MRNGQTAYLILPLVFCSWYSSRGSIMEVVAHLGARDELLLCETKCTHTVSHLANSAEGHFEVMRWNEEH